MPQRYYRQEVEQVMQYYYVSLGERSPRHYASVEAQKLGWGEEFYISKLLHVTAV